ncbi:MAG TPA: ABC transporter permease [Desulfonatronum sp.]|nr:ABC transporter permease [Desulfonatronum sp.]
MRALHRKLLRELWQMRGQALAIAVVIAGGVATLVMSLSCLESLRLTRDAFYQEHRFSDVFASLKRAPESLREAVAEIPGVRHVETRIAAGANLDIPGYDDPATALLLSLPDGRNADLNRLYLRQGRLPEAGRDREIVVNEAFADAHGFAPGDRLAAVINGRRQELEIVGVALSPEHIYQIKPGDLFPDFERYAILWINRSQLAHAFDMDGAFNDLVLALSRETRAADILDRLDALLAPYGGLKAVDRSDQISHRYLSLELDQLAVMAQVFPTIFLGVAAFLLNVVFSRLISTQREQIAVLKAFGYANREVGLHYVQLVLLITFLGVALGMAGGVWFGQRMAELYRDFFRFPFLEYVLSTRVILIGCAVSTGAGLLGTIAAVRRAVRLPPAEAMRPEPPPTFRPTVLERFGLQALFSQPTRMILRNIERRPVKSLLSALGIAMACGILMVGRFQESAIDYMLAVQFGLSQRDDLTVTFTEPTSHRVVHDLQALEGVYLVEPFRSAAVELRHAHRTFRTALQGVGAGGDLHRILDADLNVLALPEEGVALTDYLAEMLGISPGDLLEVDVLEGRRQLVRVPVAGLIKEYMGVSAYMEMEALSRLLGEGQAASGALLAIDAGYREEILRKLKDSPRVAGITDRNTAIANFMDSMADTVLIFAFFSTILAGSIAFGVIYNNARIALAERSRELASLRVLGFSRGEIGYILLGEMALITVAALPIGFLIGRGLTAYLVKGMESDLYRIPLIIEPGVFAFSTVVVLVSSLISGLIVARRLGRLDLVEVLKTKE